jgi:hypothetical protein
MYLSVTSNSLRIIKHGTVTSPFSGSSSYQADDSQQVAKKSTRQTVKDDSIHSIRQSSSEKSPKDDRPAEKTCKSFKLNKSKIRKKMSAFFNLQATREFCAFYTVTFPAGISDDDAYKLYNIWQTRCRKMFTLSSFVWVAERQKNGTIHFHLLTNTKMPIRAVNGYMRESLKKYAHIYGWEMAVIERYNGIDVDNVWYPKKRSASGGRHRRTRNDAAQHLGKYITKYVSKNNEIFSRLAWHESRDVSALFTAQNYDRDESTPLIDYFRATYKNWKLFESEHVNIYLHPTVYDFNDWLDLRAINEVVYKKIHASA